jgi:hypothetical protein
MMRYTIVLHTGSKNEVFMRTTQGECSIAVLFDSLLGKYMKSSSLGK